MAMPSLQSNAVDPVRSAFADDPDFRELLEEFAIAMPQRLKGLLEAQYRCVPRRHTSLCGRGPTS